MSDFDNLKPIPEEPTPEETPAEPVPAAENAASAENTEPTAEAEPTVEAEPTAEAEPTEPAAPIQEETPPAPPAPPAEPPKTVYRWSYADEAARSSGKTKGRGIIVYASIMTAVFLLSFGLLLAVLLLDDSAGYPGLLRPGITDVDNDDEAVVGVEQAKRSVVVIEVAKSNSHGTGTGIIMTADGYIATNHHVIEDARDVKVTFYDGRVMEAEVIGSSAMDDLAVIKVNATDLPAAIFAHSDDCYVGQTVYAIGTPASPDFGWTTTKGIISYKDREVKIYNDDDGSLEKKLRLLQTDAMVNPGNSGGPLINVKGEVVGVVSMKLTDGFEGIGFAIPSDGAVEILEAIMLYGNADSVNSSLHHKRPMLGVTGVFLNGGEYYLPNDSGVDRIPEDELDQYDMAKLLHPPVSGVYIMGFAKGMDAAAKMKEGDIITACQGEEITSMNDLSSIINEYYAGDTVTLTVYRDGAYIAVDIVLSAQTDSQK